MLYDLYDSQDNCAMAFPNAINDKGIVLGNDRCLGSNELRFETVSDKGQFTFLNFPSGFAPPNAYGSIPFNDAGVMPLYPYVPGHAYLWSTVIQGAPQDIGALSTDPNGVYTVTGLNANTAVGVTDHGFSWIWSAKKGIQDLTALAGGGSHYGEIIPQTIDARGDIGAGSSYDEDEWLYLRKEQ